MGSSIEMLSEFKDIMVKTFEMSYLGPLRYFLGLEVRQFNGALFVTQTKYAKDLLKRDGMLHSKDAINPMNTNEKLQLEDCSGSADSSRYKRLVGRLLYLTHTKLDIMYAVEMVSRFMQEPSMHHLGAVKKHTALHLRYIGLWFIL